MRSLGIVVDEELVEYGLHLLGALKPGAAALDAEMFVEEGAVQAFQRCRWTAAG